MDKPHSLPASETRRQASFPFSLNTGIALVLLGWVSAGYAQMLTPREDEREFTLYAQAIQVDNANGTADPQAEIDELRTRYGATVDAVWYREYSQFALDYDASQSHYSEDTQTEETIVDGESSLVLGTPTSFYEFEAGHSVRRLLAAPELSPTLVSNTRERQILRARPSLRSHLGRANRVSLGYEYVDIRFRDDDTNDSTRDGLDLQYLRDISPTRDLALLLSQRDIDYVASDDDDYETASAALQLVVTHRLFEYRVQAGMSEVTPLNAESYHRSIGGIALTWQQAANRLEFFANKSISDTSVGSGNSLFMEGETSFDGAAEVRDQVDRQDVGLRWSYDGLCSRCSLSANLGLQRLDYVNFSENDNEQRAVGSTFAYEFSSALTATLGVLHSESSWLDDSVSSRPDTTGQILRAAVDYQVNPHFEIGAAVEDDRRESLVAGEGDYSVRSLVLLMRLIF